MGKDPDQIERAIRDHREAISRRISDLQGRVQKDLESVRSEAQARANGAVEQAKGAFDIESQVRDHPMSSLAGAFGAGVLLGVISYRGNGGAPPAPPPSRGQLGGSFLGDIAGSLWGMAGPTLQDELRTMVREGVQGLSSSRPSERERAREYEEYSLAGS